MKRLYPIVALVVFSILSVPPSLADYGYQFVRINCITELNRIELDLVNTSASPDVQGFLEKGPGGELNRTNVRQLGNRYGLFLEGNISRKCKLEDSVFEVRIAFQAPPHAGPCGATTRGRLTLIADNRVLLKDIGFADACRGRAVERVSYHNGEAIVWFLTSAERRTVISTRIYFDLKAGWFGGAGVKQAPLPFTDDLLQKFFVDR